jgi:serine/threonine protein kinase
LKPDNIFLVADDRAKTNNGSKATTFAFGQNSDFGLYLSSVRIGDFGLAGENQLWREYSYGVQRKSLPAGGTLGYMAPELLSQESPCSDKADIFACAVILLEVLLPPFRTQMERVEFLDGFRIRNAVPEFLEVRLPKTRALLRDMGAEDPACRLSAEEVCKKFEKEVRKELSRSNIQRCCSPSILRGQTPRRQSAQSEAIDPERDVDHRRQAAKGKRRGKQRKRG